MLSFALMLDQEMPRWLPAYDQIFLWAAAFPAMGLASRSFRLRLIRPGLLAVLAVALYRAGIPRRLEPDVMQYGYSGSIALFFGSLALIVAVHESRLFRPSLTVVVEVAAVMLAYGQWGSSWVDMLLQSGGLTELIPQAKPIALATSFIMLVVVLEIYGQVNMGASPKWYVFAGIGLHVAFMLQTIISQVQLPQTVRLLANMPMLIWLNLLWSRALGRGSAA